MKQLLLVTAVALSLGACKTAEPGVGVNVGVAPLAQTSIDNKGIVYALESAETIATLVDIARDAGKLVPGTPKAQQVAGYLRGLAKALRTASAAQRLGDTGRVDLSLDEAARLAKLIRTTLSGVN